MERQLWEVAIGVPFAGFGGALFTARLTIRATHCITIAATKRVTIRLTMFLECHIRTLCFGTGSLLQSPVLGQLQFCRALLKDPQRAQYPLIKEYSLNHNVKLYII